MNLIQNRKKREWELPYFLVFFVQQQSQPQLYSAYKMVILGHMLAQQA